MRLYALVLAVFCAALAFSGRAEAATVLSENFETTVAGTWPTGWVADAGAANDYVSSDPLDSENKTLRLEGTASWASLAHHAVELADVFSISVDFMVTGSETYFPWTIDLYSSPVWTSYTRRLIYQDGGNIYGAGGNLLASGGVSAAAWHTVVISHVFSGGNHLLTYTLDGDSIGQSLISASPSDYGLQYLALVTASTSPVYFDNVLVTTGETGVPEPATLSLLALAGLGACLRRKR